MNRSTRGCLLFDWGNTLMRDSQEFIGPMKDWPRLEVIPGAAETLAALHTGWILALATNAEASGEADIRAALQRVDLDRYLDKVYCFRKIGHKKPSPAFFRYILHDLELPPGSVCMIGDDFEADILGANAFGIRAIWFKENSLDEREGELYRTIHDLRILPEALKGFI